MAIEKGTGAGGDNVIPMNAQEQIEVLEMAMQPGQVTMDDGSVIVGDVTEEMMMADAPIEIPFGDNLVNYIDDADAMSIASDLVGDVEDDISSRQDWEDTYKRGIDLLGMKYEERSQPFEGASGVVHPLLAESVTQFQAQAYRELLPAGGPVRTQIIGDENKEVLAQAERIKNYMN